jgi:hypothetical protein
MAQENNRAESRKHICIFELERKGAYFTGDVVCSVCGVRLSSTDQTTVKNQGGPETRPLP